MTLCVVKKFLLPINHPALVQMALMMSVVWVWNKIERPGTINQTHPLCLGSRDTLQRNEHTACRSCCLCCWNKTEYHESSQLTLLHI